MKNIADESKPVSEDISHVLSHYDIGEPLEIILSGGTANRNYMIRTSKDKYFLRRRNKKYCGEVQLKYDHRLMHHLAYKGITGPNPIPSKEGNTWITFKDDVYELHSFIKGEEYERKNVRKLASAGRALALYHKALEDFEDPEEKFLPRYDDPREVLAFLKEVETSLNQDDQVLETKLKVIEYIKKQMENSLNVVTDEIYSSLPHTVIHGDYHPDNVKFNGDEVCGIFDLDWASMQPKIRDIVDGILYFAADRKSDIDGGNIYSLTQPCRISLEKSRIFVTAYCEEGKLLQDEIRYIPWFIRMRWIYSRYSGTKKVPYEQRFLFFLDGIQDPLLWLDANEELFVETLSQSVTRILQCRG